MRLLWILTLVMLCTRCSTQVKKSSEVLPAEVRSPSSETNASIQIKASSSRGLLPMVEVSPFKMDLKELDSAIQSYKARECLREICGPEEKTLHFDRANELKRARHLYKPSSPIYQKVDRLLNAHLDKAEPDYKRELELIEWGAQRKTLNPTRTAKILHNSLFLFAHYFKILTPKKFTDWRLVRAYQLTDADIASLNLSTSDRDYFIEANENGFLEHLVRYFASDPESYAHYLGTYYPHLSPAEGLKKVLETCKENEKFIIQSLELPEDINEFSYCRDLDKESSDLPIDSERLYSEFKSSSIFKVLLAPEFSDFLLKREFDLHALSSEKGRSKDAQIRKELTAKTYLDHPKRAEVLKTCHENIGDFYETAVSPLRQRIARENLHLLKEEAKQLIHLENAGFQKVLEKRIDFASFTFPPTQQVFEQQLISRLKDESRPPTDFFTFPNQEKLRTTMLALMLSINTYEIELDENGDPTDLFDETKDFCESYQSNALSDHIYTGAGASYISWTSVYNAYYGIGVMAHELGHYLFKILRDMDPFTGYVDDEGPGLHLWRERTCVDRFHSADGGATYTEEDWADRFAAKLLKRVEPDINKRGNFACSMHSLTNGKYVTTLKNVEGAKHSTDFFRTLHIESILRGELPSSCEQFVHTDLTCKDIK